MNTIWTEEKINHLTTLWKAGHSASEISRRLDVVSRCAVIGKLRRIGLLGIQRPARRPPGRARNRARDGSKAVAGRARAPRRADPGGPYFRDLRAGAQHDYTLRHLRADIVIVPLPDRRSGRGGFCLLRRAARGLAFLLRPSSAYCVPAGQH